MKLSVRIFSIILLLALGSCSPHVGSVNAEGGSQPRFTFIGSSVSSLIVYRVPRKYLNKGIALDAVTKNGSDTQWRIDGMHDARTPINYGVVPKGMTEIVPAKPLSENTIYFASTYVGTEETGAFVGQYFRIQNGRTIEVHEDVDANSVNN
jgi:hypothetical protein